MLRRIFRRSPAETDTDAAALSAGALGRLPVVKAPDAIWAAIEASLDAAPASRRFTFLRLPPHVLALASLLMLVTAGAVWYWHSVRGIGWEVVRMDGAPLINSTLIRGAGRIGAGQWLQTDGRSRAEIRVDSIGIVEVGPNTLLRLVTARPDDHRLALDRGEITARISAPPRLFFVETPSGTAVDLGCAYEMKVEDGKGLLHVTAGWVSFEWNHRESLVPAGASCRTRSGKGPGTPWFDDASQSLVSALQRFDFENGADSLDSVLSTARARDTLTLWHLLSRVDAERRIQVYNRIAALAPSPSTVSREKVLALDPEALKVLKNELAWTW